MASVKARPGYGYEVRYVDPATGKRPSKTFKLKKDADAYRRQVEREIEDGAHIARASTKTYREASRDYMAAQEQRLRDGTIRPSTFARDEQVQRVNAVPLLGHRVVSEFTVENASDFIANLKRSGLSAWTMAKVLESISYVLDFAVRRKWARTNVLREARRWPENKLPLREKIRTFDQAQARLVYEYFCDPAARNPLWSKHYAAMSRAIVFIAMFMGLRSGEIRGLTWDAIDLEGGMIEVKQQLDMHAKLAPTKTAAGVRSVPAPDVVIQALRAYLPFARANPANLVFTRKTGTPVSSSTLHHHIWYRALDDLGYSASDAGGRPHFHALRHFASSMMVNHMPIGDVAPILGHRDFDTTLRVYTGATLTAAAKRDALQGMATAMLLPAA